MKQVKRIMAAIAFSRYAKDILEFSWQLAERLGCELVVVNVINIRDVQAVGEIHAMGYQVDPQDYVKGLEEERRSQLQKMIGEIGIDPGRVKIVFHVGHPLDMLLKTVEEEEIDMVVMGTKGRTDIEYVFVGSVAEKMFRRCPVPLISYRMKSA